MGDSYKAAKEAFVSGTNGSTILHVHMISSVALSSIALHSALISRLPSSRQIHFPTAWLILVFPLLLSMTLFATSPALLSVLLLFPAGLLLLIPPRQSGTPLPSPNPMTPPSPRHSSFSLSPIPTPVPASVSQVAVLPALTVYRAHMLLMTTLAILAVDFPVFPRALAKCETFGVSLMDLGVGSFVFSQGVVSAIPLLKDSAYLTAPLQPKLISVTKKILPIIFLGLIRVLLVKGTEYPEHESEYGTHWNFFITLALLPVLQVMLHPVIRHIPISLIGILVAIFHQVSLSFLGMQSFVLQTPRTGIISANKEGIASLSGYLAIHLLGLSTGTLILPPSPKFFRRRQKAALRRNSDARDTLGVARQNDKTATELCSYTVVWWVFFGVTHLLGLGNVSRRMANMSYIFWVAAYNTSFILGYLLLDLIFFPSPLSKSVYSKTSKLKVPIDKHSTAVTPLHLQQQLGNPPDLLEAFNKNGLPLFLLANIATGLVNLTISTMYTSDFLAMVVLSVYAFGMCAVAWLLRGRRIVKL
ncbi:GWT1-domain-containing protein [Tricholoma matsutake]|nr:GWT1-domain-containing protein [Tricholoma matsutake 945]